MRHAKPEAERTAWCGGHYPSSAFKSISLNEENLTQTYSILVSIKTLRRLRTKEPTAGPQTIEKSDATEIIEELREVKELTRGIQKHQCALERSVKNLCTKLGTQDFNLSKSSHAVSLRFCRKKIQ